MLVAGVVVAISGVALTLPSSLAAIVAGLVVLTAGFFAARSVPAAGSAPGPGSPRPRRRPSTCACNDIQVMSVLIPLLAAGLTLHCGLGFFNFAKLGVTVPLKSWTTRFRNAS